MPFLSTRAYISPAGEGEAPVLPGSGALAGFGEDPESNQNAPGKGGGEVCMNTIGWSDFEAVELRVGTVVRVESFPEARKPAYKVWADFGPGIGERKSSAQITAHYAPEDLVGRQIVGVLNFPPRQVGPFMSEFLLTGFADENGRIVIAVPERLVPDGAKLC